MEGEPLYDEFGNYIGPEIADDEEQQLEEPPEQMWMNDEGEGQEEEREESSLVVPMEESGVKSRAVVLFEDKKFYPSAEEVYGDAETLVQEEDTQPLTEPIIAPIKQYKFFHEEQQPETTFSQTYLTSMLDYPALMRNVALVGHLHHGKTLFMDMLVQQTHEIDWPLAKEVRYTDTRIDEQQRGVSIKAVPMSLILPNSQGKSYLLNVFDTPGHVNFSDEVTASIRLCDGVVVVIDAVEGVMVQTERLLKHAAQERLAICVVINKVDRLILELKLPPAEAYYKLRHTLDEVNMILSACSTEENKLRVSPEKGNVCFASGLMGWCFSLESFAKIYSDTHGGAFSYKEFAKRLWGDVYFHPEDRAFRRKPPQGGGIRTFVQFVLEPLYKIYSHVVGEERPVLEKTLDELVSNYEMRSTTLIHDHC